MLRAAVFHVGLAWARGRVHADMAHVTKFACTNMPCTRLTDASWCLMMLGGHAQHPESNMQVDKYDVVRAHILALLQKVSCILCFQGLELDAGRMNCLYKHFESCVSVAAGRYYNSARHQG